jgi:hypothetical protein
VPSDLVRDGAAMLSNIVWLRIPEFTHSRSPEYASRGTNPAGHCPGLLPGVEGVADDGDWVATQLPSERLTPPPGQSGRTQALRKMT